jgi:hypothetical protein
VTKVPAVTLHSTDGDDVVIRTDPTTGQVVSMGNSKGDVALGGGGPGAYSIAGASDYSSASLPVDAAAAAAAQATANAAIPASQKGAANGVAPLGSDQKLATQYLPSAVLGGLNYQGTYNASTNTPAIVAGNKGFYWKVSVAGTALGHNFSVGDWAVDNGAAIDKVDGNENEVLSVAGKTGAVTLVPGDITGLGVPTAQAGGHTFSNADNGQHVIASGTPAYVLNSGLVNGWGVSIKGAFSLSGTATVTDLRTTTGTAMCSLVQTDTAGTGLTYDLVGTK